MFISLLLVSLTASKRWRYAASTGQRLPLAERDWRG